MEKAVGSILWPCTDMIDVEVRHQFCPKGESSWCKYQRDKITGEKIYKANLNIPKWIHDIIKPVFIELSSGNLLSKCLHGHMQNSNESLHGLFHVRKLKMLFLKVSQDLETTLDYESTIFKVFCKTN